MNDDYKEITLYNGQRFLIHKKDEGLSKNLERWGIREGTATRFFIPLLNKDDIVLDIGANIGYYAMQEAKVVKQVYAVEPIPISFELLKTNKEFGNYQNVKLYNHAIGHYNGDLDLYVGDSLNLASVHNTPDKHKVTVPMLTGKTFIVENRCDANVLRMDVEGYEIKILKSFQEKIKQFNKLFIEVHHCVFKDEGTHEFLDILKENGFEKLYVILSDRVKLPNRENVIEEGWVSIDEFRNRKDYFHVTYLFAIKGDDKVDN